MSERAPKIDAGVELEPLARLARDATSGDVSEAENARGREELLASLDRSATRLPLTPRPFWLVAAALVGVFAVAMFAWPRRVLEYSIDGARVAESYVQAGSSAVSVRFSEGTEIRFQAGARGRVGSVTAHGARVSIETGKTTFRVTHLPGAVWVAEAGPFEIAVTGTEFDATWQDERLEVEVHVGSVVVRGPLTSSGVPLDAGKRLVADIARGQLTIGAIGGESAAAPSPSAEARAGEPRPITAAPASPAPNAPASQSAPIDVAPSVAPPVVSWRSRVANGDFAGVLADADAHGIDAALGETSLSDLAALADAARYAGRRDLAKRALGAERSRFGGSAEARSAAFLLGRMEESASPGVAIGWYDRYLAESPNGALASEALGRKMLLLKSTSREAARPVAEEYRRRFPNGALAAAADEILTGTAAPPASAAP